MEFETKIIVDVAQSTSKILERECILGVSLKELKNFLLFDYLFQIQSIRHLFLDVLTSKFEDEAEKQQLFKEIKDPKTEYFSIMLSHEQSDFLSDKIFFIFRGKAIPPPDEEITTLDSLNMHKEDIIWLDISKIQLLSSSKQQEPVSEPSPQFSFPPKPPPISSKLRQLWQRQGITQSPLDPEMMMHLTAVGQRPFSPSSSGPAAAGPQQTFDSEMKTPPPWMPAASIPRRLSISLPHSDFFVCLQHDEKCTHFCKGLRLFHCFLMNLDSEKLIRL